MQDESKMDSRVKRLAIVADDDTDFNQYLCLVLSQLGFEIASAINGNEAIKHYTNVHADLLVTDIVMDSGEGLETIRGFRRMNSGIPIIAISGAGNAYIYLEMARLLGATHVLSKPFLENELQKVILRIFPDIRTYDRKSNEQPIPC